MRLAVHVDSPSSFLARHVYTPESLFLQIHHISHSFLGATIFGQSQESRPSSHHPQLSRLSRIDCVTTGRPESENWHLSRVGLWSLPSPLFLSFFPLLTTVTVCWTPHWEEWLIASALSGLEKEERGRKPWSFPSVLHPTTLSQSLHSTISSGLVWGEEGHGDNLERGREGEDCCAPVPVPRLIEHCLMGRDHNMGDDPGSNRLRLPPNTLLLIAPNREMLSSLYFAWSLAS